MHADRRDGSTTSPNPTWSLLLAKWVEFAKASVALSDDDAASAAWKASVPHVIALQSVTCALGEAGELPPAERRVARDRGGVTVREAAAALNRAWGAEPMPEQLLELMQDARDALRLVETLAVHWLVASDRLDAPDLRDHAQRLIDAGYTGTLLAAPAGTTLFRHSPAAVAFPEPDDDDQRAALDAIEHAGVERSPDIAPALQVYRQTDDAGRPTRDLVAPLATQLPAGMPLLLPLIQDGALTNATPRPSALPDGTRLPIHHQPSDAEHAQD